MRPSRPRPIWSTSLLTLLAWCLGPAAVSAAQGPAAPEVVRLRVPDAMLSGWFPGRVGLTPLEPGRFEALVRGARETSDAREAARLIEPLRIEHRARLDGGELVGTTALRFPGLGDGPRWAALWPWSPAVESITPGSVALVHRDLDGRAFLRLEPGDDPGEAPTVEIAWRLRPRVEAEGRIFDLELIEGPATALVLDLPAGVTPSGPPGYREGPEPTGEDGRSRWRFDGPGGALVLRLRSAPDPERPTGPWIGGATLVELDGDGAGAPPRAGARWTSTWEVDPGPEGHRPLDVALGPGVAWEDATGPEGAVAGIEAVPGPEGTRLTVRWRDGLIGPTRLTLSGLARIDDPGRWIVPGPRPVGAQWVGGPVVVRVGRSWTLVGCRERSGRRLDLEEVSELSPELFGDGTVLAFFADRPAPVAELHLEPARGFASASVRGTVRLRDGADTLEAEVDYEPTLDTSSLVTLELSPGWMPEAVRLADGQPVPRWEQESLPDGRRLLRAHLPGAPGREAAAPRRPELVVSASLIREDSRIMDLPRLRPTGVAVADERWSILGGSKVALRPVEAEGLAWLDPAGPIAPTATEGDPPRALLSWRWVAPGGRGRAAREAVPARPLAIVGQRATIAGGRLTIDWDVRLDPRGEVLRGLPFRIRPEPDGPEAPAWSLVAADGQATQAVPVVPSGDSAELRLPRDLAGPVALAGRLELPWEGEGPLPVLDLPRRFETRGTVSLRVDPALLCEARGDFSFRETTSSPSTPAAEQTPTGSTRLAESFLYDGRPGVLVVRTTPLPKPPAGGVILRADLASWSATGGPSRNRLSLDVAAGDADPLGITMPAGATPGAAWCDGRPVEPYLRGNTVQIPLPRPEAEASAPSARPLRVVLDFEGLASGGRVEPDRPRFSMPCLSFSWRLTLPTDRTVSATGPALTPADPGPDRRGWLPGLHTDRLQEPTAGERLMLDQLDERAAAVSAVGRTLGGVLASWDVGRWPLLVDRAALEAEGIGPRSSLPPSSGGGGAGAARRMLAPMGLLAVPIDTALLVTTVAEAPRFSPTALAGGADWDAWSQAVREAVAFGSDRSDRFRTVERWRASSGAVAGSPPNAVGPSGTPRAVRRFVATGWPASGAGVRTVDRWPWLASGVGLGLLLVALAWARLPGRGWAILRLTLLLGVAAAAALVASRGGPRWASAAVGPFYGGLIGVGIALVRGRSRVGRGEMPGSTIIRAPGSTSRAAVGAGLLLATIVGMGGAQPGGPSPIVAFQVDEGGEGEAGPGATVWLRTDDERRLVAAASARPSADPPASWPTVGAVASRHDLRPDGDGSWILETRLTLRFDRDGPATWSLPVGRAVGLEATFDGQARPVLIEPMADRASVAIDGSAGPHELVVRQRVRPEDDAGGRRLLVPINPVASATIDLVGSADGPEPTLARSRGPTTPRPDGRLRAAIGPVDRIEVAWEAPDGEGPETAAPRVEGLLLWQAMPAADRLDARLTVGGTGPIRELWFAVEPGVAVRSARVAGAIVEGSRIVADDGDRWVARIDPPLSDGGTLQVELWRPRGDVVTRPDAEARRPPRLEPIGVAGFEGRLALMRPESWGGRIGATPGDDAISEQEFEQDWGPLPRGAALEPAGAVRFTGRPAVAAPIGPTPPRRRATPTLQLDLDAGRWEWRLAAEVADLDGRTIRDLSVRLPDDLELVDVEAPGLTAWDRPKPDRLRLRFDGPAGSTREVAVGGWIPQPGNPMEPGPLAADRPLPWPGWHDAAEQPGSLLLSSPTTALIGYRGPEGLPVPVEWLTPSNNRRPYRPIRVDRPGTLRIESFPAVTVELWSQLIVGTRSARWESLVRYEVAGGPADRIELILPDDWAEGAEFELDGLGPIAVRDLGDRVEIVPGRPIWGAADLRIRSVRPLEADRPLNFPDLVLWGRGSKSGHAIAVVVPADRGPSPEFSGLEPADSATRDRLSAVFSAPLPPDATRRFYRVRREGWSLVVRPSSAAVDGPLDAGEARVDLADVSCVIGPDGTVRGHAAFDLQPAPVPAPFLTLRAPPGATAPAAVVDGRAVLPRLGTAGRWVVPLGDGPARRVELVWVDPAAPEDRRGRRIALPEPVRDGAAALIAVCSDPADSIGAAGGATLPTPAASLLVERLERAAEQLRARLGGVGSRPDGVDRDALAPEVARLLTLQRQAERSAYWAALMRPDTAEVVRQRGPLRRIVAAREALDGALLAAGLPDLLASSADAPDPGPPVEWLSFLRPGLPHHFRAEVDAARPISFDWTPADAR